MLSTPRMLLVGALVAVGVFAIGRPFGPVQDDVPAVNNATLERAAPVEFSGQWAAGATLKAQSIDNVDGVIEYRGGVFEPLLLEVSEPRLDGRVILTVNRDNHGGINGVDVWRMNIRIETDEGSWQGVPTVTYGPNESMSTRTSALVGEGAYAGLTAIIEVSRSGRLWNIHGSIIDGEMPPDPSF